METTASLPSKNIKTVILKTTIKQIALMDEMLERFI